MFGSNTRITIALFVLFVILPIVIAYPINYGIFQPMGEKQYKKNLANIKTSPTIKKTLENKLFVFCIKGFIYFNQNKIVDLVVFIIFTIAYWIYILVSKLEFSWFNYVSLSFQILFLIWFIVRIFSIKLNSFFFNFGNNKVVELQPMNTKGIKDSLLKLKLINFNPISKKDRKQVKKIYKLIYETQYLIRVNDQISLSYSCILLYYNMFIYQDNKNDEVCNFINDSFNKNIIKNKELL